MRRLRLAWLAPGCLALVLGAPGAPAAQDKPAAAAAAAQGKPRSASPDRGEYKPLDGVAARVNGEVVTWNDVRRKMANMAQVLGYPTPAERERVLERYALERLKSLVEEKLLLQRAKQEHIQATEAEIDRAMQHQQRSAGSILKLASEQGMTISELRRAIRDDILRLKFEQANFHPTRWARRLRRYSVRVSPGEVRDYYRKHRAEFHLKAAVWLRRLSILAEDWGGSEKAKALGRTVIQELERGMKPADVDAKYKLNCDQFRCPVEDLVPVSRLSGLRESIKRWAFASEPGAVSELIPLGPGVWAVFYLEKKRGDVVRKFEEVQGEIEAALMLQRRSRAQRKMRLNLFRQADIGPPEFKSWILGQGPRPSLRRDILVSILGKP